jgi:hypothetical protein
VFLIKTIGEKTCSMKSGRKNEKGRESIHETEFKGSEEQSWNNVPISMT